MATRIAEAEVLVKVIDKLFTVFQDPRALLDALNDCNCILSGQFVVNLLNPTHMPTVDCVDVLAGDDRFALFAHHLERKERGRVVAHVEDVPDFTPGSYKYAHIFTCAKSTVRVVRSNNNSPFYLVPHYPATHLMNYLTFDHLAVAYPTLTFAGKGVQVAGHIDNALVGDFTVDYRSLICDGDTCETSAACGDRMRWFNDEESVSIGYGGMYEPHGLVHWCLGGAGCTVTCRSQPDRVVDFDP
ncbi:hypothetical protein BC629DRAFT_1440969 [Irpex lacteus]|nr:hypothetical protein BC629DRAFT_1598578 [Irpex lacteus]KAI0781724.1 hypothetical protein BC629DRAFT_1440969 [Irpex lacteus]